MKNSVFILLLVSFILACDKGPDDPYPAPIVLKDLQLQMGRDSVPLSLLTTHTKAVFVNKDGDEKVLSLEYKPKEVSRTWNTYPYQSEIEWITYTDSSGLGLWMGIHAQIEYASSTSTHEMLIIMLSPWTSQGFMSTIHMFSEPGIFYNRFFPNLEIAGLNFTNVYADESETFPPGDSYTEVYYNTSLGIVVFEGVKGEMWGLKRYE